MKTIFLKTSLFVTLLLGALNGAPSFASTPTWMENAMTEDEKSLYSQGSMQVTSDFLLRAYQSILDLGSNNPKVQKIFQDVLLKTSKHSLKELVDSDIFGIFSAKFANEQIQKRNAFETFTMGLTETSKVQYQISTPSLDRLADQSSEVFYEGLRTAALAKGAANPVLFGFKTPDMAVLMFPSELQLTMLPQASTQEIYRTFVHEMTHLAYINSLPNDSLLGFSGAEAYAEDTVLGAGGELEAESNGIEASILLTGNRDFLKGEQFYDLFDDSGTLIEGARAKMAAILLDEAPNGFGYRALYAKNYSKKLRVLGRYHLMVVKSLVCVRETRMNEVDARKAYLNNPRYAEETRLAMESISRVDAEGVRAAEKVILAGSKLTSFAGTSETLAQLSKEGWNAEVQKGCERRTGQKQ